jgi:hypothetical protein
VYCFVAAGRRGMEMVVGKCDSLCMIFFQQPTPNSILIHDDLIVVSTGDSQIEKMMVSSSCNIWRRDREFP